MRFKSVAMMCICLSALLAQVVSADVKPAVSPFDNAQWPVPKGYTGSTFTLSHDYPRSAPKPAMPWRTAIRNQPISTGNAEVYVGALKASLAEDMRVLLQDYEHWDAGKRGWYNEPWMGKTTSIKNAAAFREPLRGMYVGSTDMPAALFASSGLTEDFTTYVLTYYNNTAAVTLNKIWGTTAMTPNLTPSSTQFAEGSVIIKAAFTTASPKAWPVMKGTVTWPAFAQTNAGNPHQPDRPVLTPTYLMQFDIIVKDSVSAPKTGWVFSTLVYDTRVPTVNNDIWKKMVPLGAQWGNDPQASDPNDPKPTLMENWNNPKAPAYGRATLGWGERLSGPNDGAMNDIVYTLPGAQQPTVVQNAKDSSCMSCHSSAQWNTHTTSPLGMTSFLLPALTQPPQSPPRMPNYIESPVPGSPAWMKWFQNRQGTVPMDVLPGNVAGDFDMVLTFKSLPAWFNETQVNSNHTALDYRGRPLMKLINPSSNGR